MVGNRCFKHFILILLFLLFVFSTTTLGSQPQSSLSHSDWPSEQEWNPGLDRFWNKIEDSADQQQDYHDVVTDPIGGSAYYWYFDGTNLFMRLVIRGEPLNNISRGTLKSHVWMFLIDSTGDDYPNYAISLYGTAGGGLETLYNTRQSVDMEDNTSWSYTTRTDSVVIDDYIYLLGNYARRLFVPHPSGDVYYLDWYVPMEWLARKDGSLNPAPITEDTPIKLAAGTGTSRQQLNRELAGSTGPINIRDFFASAPSIDLKQNEKGYGVLFDSRNEIDISNSGFWYPNETVAISGYGWPNKPSPTYTGTDYYGDGTLDVLISDPNNQIVWEGTINFDEDGDIGVENPIDISTIGLEAESGVYAIKTDNLRNPGEWIIKDTFTVSDLGFVDSVKQVNKEQVLPGGIIQYTIELVNTSNQDFELSIIDKLSELVEYVPGTLMLDGITQNDTNGFPLGSEYQIIISGGSSRNLSYDVKVLPFDTETNPIQNGTEITNSVEAYRQDLPHIKLEFEAMTEVVRPVLGVEKSENTALGRVMPGDEVTFTTKITNYGQADALNISIKDEIPHWTSFISAGGPSGTQIEYLGADGTWYSEPDEISVRAVRWSDLSLPAFDEIGEAPSLSLYLIVQVD